jgi:phage tail sheath protein FI
LRSSVEAALEALWRRTAFVGHTAADAFFVNCDSDVNVPDLAEAGRTRVEFGFALKVPGEFIRMAVEQPTGDVQLYAD